MSDSYFQGGTEPGSGPLRVVRGAELRTFEVAPGVSISPLLGAGMNINVVVLDDVAAVHSHDEEQMGYIVSGRCEFTDGTDTWTLEPGDCYHAPPGAPHGARPIGGRCVIIDTFAPARAGIRELLEGA